jgi:hypothetical protein
MAAAAQPRSAREEKALSRVAGAPSHEQPSGLRGEIVGARPPKASAANYLSCGPPAPGLPAGAGDWHEGEGLRSGNDCFIPGATLSGVRFV